MTHALPASVEHAFTLAAGELGMCSAAWQFANAVGERAGPPVVGELRERLGRPFPVLDAVCREWLAGQPARRVDVEAMVTTLGNAARVLVVGLEARWLDALTDALPASVRLGLLRSSPFDVSWARVAANLGRVELVELSEFQRWSGARAALITFVYGTSGSTTFALPTWLRVMGPDVRTQFRAFVGWEVLGTQLSVYPRWLAPVETAELTAVV